MRRNLFIAAAWVAATVLSVLIAATAVGSVRDQVTDRPAPIVTVAVALSVDATDATSGTVGDDGSTTTSAPRPSSDVTSTTDGGSATNGTVTSTTATTTTTPSPASTTSTSAPRDTTSTTTSTTTTSAPFTVTSHELMGGWVRIRYNSTVVLLDSASPKSGFVVEAEKVGPEEVKIEFEGPDHKSTFRARFEDGALDVSLEEEADDD